MLSQGTTQVGMFLAALTGKNTFVRAKTVQQDYAASLTQTAKSSDRAAKAVKKAAKDAKGSLAPWDELNTIQMNLADTMDGTADKLPEINPEDMFEEVPIRKSIKDFADEIRNLVKKQDWNGIGKLLGQKVNKGLEKINHMIRWENAGDDIEKYIDAITGIFNSLVDEIDWRYMGSTAGEGANTFFKAMNLLIDKTKWKKLGKSFAEAVNGFIDEVDWEEAGNFFGNKIMVLWDILNGAVHELEWAEIGISAAELLNGAFRKISFKEIADTLTTGANGAFLSLGNFTETFEWDALAENVASGMNTAISEFEWKENGKKLEGFLDRFLGTILKAAEETDWEGLGKGIGEFLSEIHWGEHLGQMKDILVEILGGIWEGLGDTSAGKFIKGVIAFKLGMKLMPFINHLVEFFTGETVGMKLTGAFSKMLDSPLKEAAESAGESVTELTSLKEVFAKNLTELQGIEKIWGAAAVSFSALYGFSFGEWISTTFLGGEKKSPKEFVEDNIIGYRSGDISGAFNEFWKEVTNSIDPPDENDFAFYKNAEEAVLSMVRASELTGEQGFEILKYLGELERSCESSGLAVYDLQNKFEELGLSYGAFETAMDGLSEAVGEVGTVSEGTGTNVSDMADRLNSVTFEGIEEQLTGFQTLVQKVDFATLVADTANAIDEMGGIWEDGKQILGEKALQIQKEIEKGLEPDENGYYHLANGQMVEYGKGISDYGSKLQSTLDETLQKAIKEALPEGNELCKGSGKNLGKNFNAGILSGMDENRSLVSDATIRLLEDCVKKPAAEAVQVHSPSAWFANLAKLCGQGFTEELEPGFRNTFAFFGNFRTRIRDSIGSLESVGWNSIIGMNNGMVRAADVLYKNASSIAGNISAVFRNALKIHSPSKVMELLGEYTMKGFEVGMEGWMDRITNLAVRWSEKLQSVFSFDLPGIKVPLDIDSAGRNVYPRQMPVMAGGTVIPPKTVKEYSGKDGDEEAKLEKLLSRFLSSLQETLGEEGDGRPLEINLILDGDRLESWLVERNRRHTDRTGHGLFEGV